MSTSNVPPLSTAGILGTDGQTPIYNSGALWKEWNLTEIYNGGQGANRYVPNINDYVVDTTQNLQYICTSISPTTMIATLVPVVTTPTSGVSTNDQLIGPVNQTYRLYIDDSVIPYVVAVDARLHVAGSMVTTCKIFLGYDTSSTGTVISSLYDQSGHLLSQSIPLELVAEAGLNNISIKTVPVCYTTQTVANGEPVTVEFYSANGNVVSQATLLVENTAFIRTTSSFLKYVTGISLQTPFLSSSNPNVIQYPMNVPLNGMSLMGVVNYSDGSSISLPVDGTKFSIFGFKDYIATVVGQEIPLVLKYTLSSGEIVYGATSTNAGANNFITEEYVAITEQEDGVYTVKLFCYPVWNNVTNSYSLEWYLYNLQRNTVFNVTPFVTITPNSQPFNSTAFGLTQNLTVSINLNQANPIYTSYINVQTITIVLTAAGTDRTGTNWTVGYSPGQNPPFGVGNHATMTVVESNVTTVDVSCGQASQQAWLNQLYYLTEPLTDPITETAPPVPNMFAISYNGQDFQYTIDQWNIPQTIGVGLVDNGTLLIKFFLRTSTNDIQLSIAGLPIWETPLV